MEVAIPATSMDFDFNEARPMPFLSAPSTPKRFGDYTLSAPTSPSRMREFYSYFDSEEFAEIPFQDKTGSPKPSKAAATNGNRSDEDDFAFDFSGKQEKNFLTADELFDEGRIRPLQPPSGREVDDRSPLISPRSPRSPRSPIEQGKKIIRGAFSPRKKKVTDPFAVAAENNQNRTENQRGRERVPGLTSSSSKRAARSLSPFRVSAYPWEEEEKQRQPQQTNKQSIPNSRTLPSNPSSIPKSSSRGWRLRDLLLFRSASDGRAYGKDPLRKFTAAFHSKDTNSQSTQTAGTGSSSRRRGPVSAHELHYTTNKAASDNMKKKTFLPYKQGILGRFAFNPN